MGEVYLARDTTLNRDVAIKVLPQAFANDSERLARFTREARTLAATVSSGKPKLWPRSITPTSRTFTASRHPAACLRS